MGHNGLKGVKTPIVCVLPVERAENMVVGHNDPLGAWFMVIASMREACTFKDFCIASSILDTLSSIVSYRWDSQVGCRLLRWLTRRGRSVTCRSAGVAFAHLLRCLGVNVVHLVSQGPHDQCQTVEGKIYLDKSRTNGRVRSHRFVKLIRCKNKSVSKHESKWKR